MDGFLNSGLLTAVILIGIFGFIAMQLLKLFKR